MKHSLFKWALAPLVACALLAPAQLLGQAVKFEATGWQVRDIMPGVPSLDANGVLHVLGYAHVIKFESTQPLLGGRGTAVLNIEIQADGTRTFAGIGYTELGTWASDGNFNPTGGVWDGKFSGVVNADGTIDYKFSAWGIGGPIEGLHCIMTATKASPDPSVPYLFSGTITGAAGK